MNIKTCPRAIRFYKERPVVEVYKDYEIRYVEKYEIYEVIAALGIYSHSSDNIESCKEFIDNLVKYGIKQDDNEEVAKFVLHIKPYDNV